MFFLKARPESDWHAARGASEITIRPEIFFEADREFQDVQRDFSSPESKPPKRRLNIFMRRRKPLDKSGSATELKTTNVQDSRCETSSKTKAKKKFLFMRHKTKSNPDNDAQTVRKPLSGFSEPRSDVDEFKYSDVSTFVKIQDCDLPNTSFLRGDLKTLMKVAETVPEESPCHSFPLGNYEGTSISESFSWKTDIWKDPWCDPPQSPSVSSWADDHSESQTSSTLEKRRKPFFPFRTSSESAKNSDNKRGSCRKYGKKGIDLETTKQLNQMISLVASEESEDPWEESWNRWQSSDTFTADSLSENERMTPDSGWADFSIFDKPPQTASPKAVDTGRTPTERLMNTSKDSTVSIASHDNVPPLYEGDSLPALSFLSSRSQKRQRPRSWFRPGSKQSNSNVLLEAQTLLDILHETFPEQELGSPDSDLRTVRIRPKIYRDVV